MRLTELTRRLEGAADELARMRSELSHEAPLKSPGPGPAHELITMVNSAWSKRQTDLATLTSDLTELADNVHLAATRYTATDESAAASTSAPLPWDTTINHTTTNHTTTDRSPTADRSAATDGSHRWTP